MSEEDAVYVAQLEKVLRCMCLTSVEMFRRDDVKCMVVDTVGDCVAT